MDASDGLGAPAAVQTRVARGPNCGRWPEAVVSKVGGAGEISWGWQTAGIRIQSDQFGRGSFLKGSVFVVAAAQ